MRPKASHLGSRKRHGCTSHDVTRGFLRSAQSNGVEHRRAAQRCAGNVRTRRNASGSRARGSPHIATQGPNCLFSYDVQHAATFRCDSFRRARNEIGTRIQLASIASHRRMDTINREAARQLQCLDCVKGCPKLLQLSRRKILILCISCAPRAIAVQNSSILTNSCYGPLTNSTTVNDFITTATRRLRLCSELWRSR
jgi:hypothetical protein